MRDFIDVGVLERSLDQQKQMMIGMSRGIDALAGKRGGSKPSKPERRPGDTVLKSAVAELLRPMTVQSGGRVVYEKSAAEVSRSLYASDHDLHAFVERAVAPPAMSTVPGNAAELVQTSTAVLDFLAGDAPSGFAALAAQTLNVPMGRVKVPSRVYPIALCGSWIGEGAAKPVYSVPLTSIEMSPNKLVAITAWTDELALYAVSTIETLMRDALRHDLNGLLDSTAFDAAAGSLIRPAGLFNGATAVTASTATPLTDAMAKDLAGLVAAVSTGAPGAKPVFVMNPAQAMRLTLAAPGFTVITSGYMAAGSVGCVDAGSVVTMLGDLRFNASSDATVHMADPAVAIAPVGATNISSPVSSLFQMNMVGLRSVLFASWQKRRSGATALCSSASW